MTGSSGGGGPTATDLDRALQWPKECTEEVTRNEQLQPCERAAVALRIDPTDGLPYAVCARHARAVMVPLAAVAARLVAERERADTAEAEANRLREVNADEGHRVRTLQRLKQVADQAAESAEERATEAEQSFRNATEVVITLSARVSAAEAALTRIRDDLNDEARKLRNEKWAEGWRKQIAAQFADLFDRLAAAAVLDTQGDPTVSDFHAVDAYIAGLEDQSGMPELLAERFAAACYIDGCRNAATYIVHSYPDTVRLCAAHRSLHPVEPHETLCMGAGRCRICSPNGRAS